MNIRIVCICSLFVAASSSAFSMPLKMDEQAEIQSHPEMQRVLIAQRNAPINSQVRLQEHLQNLSPDSPLRVLSTPARERFVASLRFNESGITSLGYNDIVGELTYTEAYRLLALFGAERILDNLPKLRMDTSEDQRVRRLARPPLVEDHLGYACTDRATCSMSSQQICMTGC
ncbi:hypothetical protein [Stenotrophomonas sp.]|uniref:hypothetical protein n=1 Tax=Stenotrophomonas sp. TaxID=69392 RepID=UPI0029B4B498|nr:hypothetical protein [Stenotrophomonas sp.]MDX3936708.1 hypothetical protein [Stenotrophomonas sp.]